MTKARDIASATPAPSTVSATELGYLDGVSSAIQTQIDSKIGSASAINPTIVDAKGDIIAATAADTVSRLAVGSNDQVLTADSSTATGLKWAAPATGATYAIFVDEKASGGGGTFTSGAWRTRDLNTTRYNGITGCSLSSNQITLAAGTYVINAMAPAMYVDQHQTRFYNITDSTTAILGGNAYNAITTSSITTYSALQGGFTITAQKTFELQHRCTTTDNDTGFGQNHGWGNEVYSMITIEKVA